MNNKDDLTWFENKISEIQKRGLNFVEVKESLNPKTEALKIILVHMILGVLWVPFSNDFIWVLVRDEVVFRNVLKYKGWLYVAILGFVFYFVIKNRMILFKEAVDTIFEGYEELTATNEELIAMEEELMQQYDQIKDHRDALAISEQRYQTLAYYDVLTNLPNRVMFGEKVEELLDELKDTDKKMAIVYLDIDNFKHINDTLGHSIGDNFIVNVGQNLSDCVKSPDIVCRIGGDEFAVILLGVQNQDDVVAKINCMLKHVRKPWSVENHNFFTTVSMGAAIYPEHGTTLLELMQNADAAMFEVKEHGKDGFCIFTPHIKEKTLHHVEMSNQLRTAIDNEEFQLYYQPQVELDTGNIIGVEALIRWTHPQKGMISPVEFIPLAEKIGHIEEIGQWVFRTACKQKREWREAGFSCIKVSINVSGKELTKGNLVKNIKNILETNCTVCKYIEIEITETAIMTNLEEAIKSLEQLKQLGVTIALDDFGTGYSSLMYLQRLPIDVLKLDRELIRDLIDTKEDFYIFKAIVELANNLGLKVVAEGIETKEQLDFLIKNGCNIGQGYYFSKPVPASQIQTLFREGF